MRRADIDDGTGPGTTGQKSAKPREARGRIKLLEQGNEVLRRAAAYLSQAHLPGKGSTRTRTRNSRAVDDLWPLPLIRRSWFPGQAGRTNGGWAPLRK